MSYFVPAESNLIVQGTLGDKSDNKTSHDKLATILYQLICSTKAAEAEVKIHMYIRFTISIAFTDLPFSFTGLLLTPLYSTQTQKQKNSRIHSHLTP